MPGIISDQVAGEEVKFVAARVAVNEFDPEKVFYRDALVAIERAVGAVAVADFLLKFGKQGFGGGEVGVSIEVADLLSNDPGGHGVDVEANHVASDTVGL